MSLEDALKAGVQLRFSRYAALFAAIALAVGVGVMQLWQPTKPPESGLYLLQMEGDGVRCTTLLTLPDGSVTFGDGTYVSGASAITPVGACPGG